MPSGNEEARLRQAAVVIQDLKKRLTAVEKLDREPIAIVGMSCRMPGGERLDEFWRVLDEGIDPIANFVSDRFETSCGVIDTITELDAGFFRISPREARRMDPRQRLLLETGWEALEDAGIPAESLEGERVGVYVGASGLGHAAHAYRVDDEADTYEVTGSLPGVIAGRVSYFLGLRGPSMTIDTACSSSLVAVHVAMKALRARECKVALAGGVGVVPRMRREVEAWLALSHISKVGRCRTFDASADGIVLSDGCGIVVLKRLSTAKQDGDRVLAVIRGSAVNHDGRAQGLTVPSGIAQEDVILQALAQAGVKPHEVGYVECHGTGTRLGDPIEVQALGAVLSEGRERSRPVLIGSVKSNLGHTDAAAGVAGLIKVVLSLRHGRIPKNLHFDAPNPLIAWDELAVKVVSEPVGWARNGAARIAGVSSFGVSGTNAHVVVEEAPAEVAAAAPAPSRSAELFVVSAKSEAALAAAASRLAEHVKEHEEESLADIACSLAMTRSHHEHRLALAAGTRAALASGLEAASRGEAAEGLSRGRAIEGRSKVAFVFSGQGSQSVGMGRGLYDEWPVFREGLEAAWSALDPHLEGPLRDVMWASPSGAAKLDETGWTQPALFALEVALSALWRSWGVEADVVAGHSIGELSAAYVAGVFSLTDAARLVAARGRLMQALARGGAMVSIAAPEAEVAEAILAQDGRVSIAAVNGPLSIVVSGEEEGVLAVSAVFSAKGARTRRLPVSHAFHSALMDPMLEEFRRVAGSIAYRPAQMDVVSNVSGEAAGSELSTADYWVRHVREAVRFAAGVGALHARGVTEYVELGPRPTLLGLIPACLPAGAKEPVLVASLRPDRAEAAAALDALGTHYAQGGRVAWEGVFASGGRRVALPTYAWQRQRYWIEASALHGRGGKATGHPLLGVRVSLAGAEAVYETVLSRAEHPWLYDHRVVEAALLPGAGLAEMMRAAGEHCLDGEAVDVASLVLQAPLMLPEHGGRRVQVVVREDDDGRREASVYSQPSEASPESGWTLHASGEIGRTPMGSAARIDLAAVRQRCRERVDVAQAYEAFAATGLSYGPAFQGMQSLWRGPHEAIAEVSLPEGVEGAEQYGMHPALLDAAFQSSLCGIAEQEGLYLPFAMERVRVHASGASAATVHVRRREEGDGEGFAADVTVTDGQGVVLAEVTGLRGRAMEGGERREEEVSQSVYQLGWPVSPVPASSAPSGRWAVVARAEDAAADAVVEELRRSGASCVRVEVGGVASALPCDHVVCLWRGWGEEAASAAERLSCEGLSVVQVVARQESPPRLWWVTRGAVSVTADEAADVGQASLWGLGRTVMQEHPELECRLVDVEDGPEVAAAITRELCGGDEEREIAWRGGERHAARVMRAAGIAVPSTENYALAIKRKGTLDGLALVPAVRRRAGRGEVEIEVRASGINFRDVLNVLGMYPGEAGPLGGEFAGVVTAVGEGVEAIAVGASVMGLAAGSFGRYVIADARLVARMPAGLSYEQAATIPVAFLTAWYALHDLAGLKAGERLLVHAAAGGVGMAAVQIARWIGAEVFGTASPSKWEAVRSLGVRAVAHSRELSFVGEIRSATGGANVDVVLNALSGDFVDASLTLLGAGGRFIEMGKTDIREARTVSASHPGVHYRAFDLSEAGAERLAAMLGTIVEGFVCGRLEPLPVRKFAITESETAFRFMAQARHVGKLALVPSRALRSDGTVVITGGLGALGLHVARWLARRGVKHLVLTGRRGLETPGAAAAVEELSSLGARVTVAAVDVSDGAAVRALLGAIPEDAPLRGVVHAAGVLDDGMLSEQSAARFARVLSAKVGGACHLDALTRGLDLDFFVLFSSTSGALGSAGQGGYSAANVCLDAVAACRRAAGLPGQSLSWGLWVDASSRGAGLASGLDRAQQSRLEKSGFGAVDASRGMALFESVLGRSEAHLLPVPIDVRALRQSFGESVPPLWRSLVRARPRAASASRRVGWAGELALLSEGERLAAVVEIVRGEVARVLSLEGAQAVEADRPLKELGLDSLMAVELRNALGKRAGARLPATLAFDHPTPRAIARYLLEKVLLVSASVPAVTPVIAAGAAEEAIAIVGIGCRYPGGILDPETFWRVLEEGLDAVTEVPRERWDVDALYDPDPDAAGKMTTRCGGFLKEIDRFDAGFFGISPREAVSMDPQQRLLLETSWEALERAGIAAEGLTGSMTGVFVGLIYQDYATLGSGLERLDGYVGTGSAASVASGRISYALGLQGPSMTVDTACSSSLVTVHLASQALRHGECSLALAGGVSVMLTPSAFVEFSRLRGLSADGRCRSFSASADGTGWSEGCGMLVLERLSDARRNGHRVLAVIRGSAVNQDGRSNGLTAPNGPSQEAVIRQALAQAGVKPHEVGYVECHGTGTRLGDPIEVQALGAVLSEGRERSRPVLIGSVKSNLGHTQAAAGVAGVIKVVLSLRHGRIPKNLHFDAPNPLIAWDELAVKVVSEPVGWARNGAARIAGVSSFGVSGTNAHVVVEEAPAEVEAAAPAPSRSAELFVVSAKSEVALAAAASRLAEHVKEHEEESLSDIACSLAMTRSHHEHRLALAAGTRAALASGLEAASRGEAAEGLSRGRAIEGRSKVAFVFSGQGSQSVGMGRGLYDEWPVFREGLEAAWSALDPHLEGPLRDVMWASPSGAAKLDETGWTQPALFALEVALSALWRSWGVAADVVAGHSIGELSAAYVAGVFSLTDAARLVAARGRLMQALARGGAMVSIAAPEAEVAEAILAQDGRVSIAAVNGPLSIVVSGEEEGVLAVSAVFSAKGARTRRLPVSHAFHSALMDPMLEEFRRVAGSIAYRPAQMEVVSNVSGEAAGSELSTADYWVRHVREAVRFAAGVGALHARGVTEYVELGPRPTLLGLIPACLPAGAKEPVLVASLRPDRAEAAAALDALGTHYAQGGRVAWEGVFASGGRRVALPTYAWQRQRYWIEASALHGRGGKATGHPLLGVRVSLAGAEAVYETVLSRAEHPWLYDHRVVEAALLPGAGLAEMMRAAGEHCFDGEAVDVASLVLQAPLMLPEHGGRRVQVVVREEDGRREASVYSQPSEASPESGWTLHASGEIGRTPMGSAARIDLAAVRQRCRERVDVAQAYEAFAATGLSYGPAFQGMQSLWRGPHEAIAEVSLPEGVEGAEQYGMHPALLDAAFQSSLCGIAEQEGLYLPFAMERVRVHASGASAATVHVRRREEGDGEGFAADVTVTDGQGVVLAEVTGLRGRAMEGGERREEEVSQSVYQLGWPVSPVPASSAPSGRWAVVARAEDAAADAVVEELRRSGASCVRVEVGGVASALPCDHVVCLWRGWGEEAASAAERLSCEGLSVVQVVARQESPPRLWWVTRGAVSVTADEAADVGQASLWGLGRTVMQEHPELECRLVDVEDGPEVAAAITRELCGGDEEREIAWRGGERHAARVMRAAGIAVPSTENYALAIKRKGTLDGLALVPAVRRRAGRGEVEIEVRASGINFRDVLNVLGMYPGEAGPLGGEFAGVVTAVGEGVEAIAVGASVMGLAAGSFGRYVIADARLVARMPAGLSYEQAATIPVAFLTAWYALHDLAGLKAGERLLVHAAAGGVGMAAVQIARWIGAEVFGTASPSKWEAVRSLGVRAVAHSRELSFVGEIRSATGGANVDVVLNALSGDFVDASLTLLGAGGRFIEMGKTDIREARTVSASHPGVHYRAFDLSEAGAERLAAMLGTIVEGFVCGRLEPLPVRKFAITESETAFRFMAQARHVGKLALVPSRALRSDGTVVITGGLGALGLHVARWLARRGVKHLVLTGRRGLETPGAAAAVEELSSLGARVTVAAVDVSDGAAVRALLGAIPEDAPLRGVVHAAGVLDDGMLSEQSAARFARVLSAKVGGACHLDALTRGLDLDFFVLFSSTSGALGSAGQGGYSAANVCLDAVAACRRAAGLPGQSLSWGLWVDASSRGAGLASGLDRAQQSRLEKSGFGAVDASRGMALFESVLGRSEAHLLPVPIDVRALRQSFGESVPPLWRSLVRARPRAASASRRVGWAGELALLSEGERLAAVVEIVRGEVARVLSLEGAQAVEADRPLKELGLDSLMAVELRNALGKRAGARLPATLAFDHPTPRAIARYLLEKVLLVSASVPAVTPVIAAGAAEEAIAIVGIGCRYPGGILDPETFWRVLEEGLDAVTEVPRERWDVDALYDPDPDAAGKMTTRCGGFLKEIDRFDAGFFGISPREAVSMDPQQRLLLETSWEALERAGIAAEGLTGSMTGVFVGLIYQEYATLGSGLERLDGYVGTGSWASVASGRISYALGLQGPSMTVDTACSSSLVTVHLASQALRHGECSLALAGGVSVMLTPSAFVEFSRLRGLSADGRCRSFSASADGTGWSEGCGMLVLERLNDARRNGHRVLAVIRGSAVNQDGRSNGLTAPNGPSQEAVIRQALAQAGVKPHEVGYVECHGTGTRLGDPIEVQALGAVLSEGRERSRPVLIGSVKSNLGHTQAAAGVAGVIKVVLSLRHGRIPKNLHFDAPNPLIAWDELAVKVVSEPVGWARNGAARIAGVSSFGVSGTNAHVVVEEAPAEVEAAAPAPSRSAELFVVSAKSEVALAAAASRLAEHVKEHEEESLSDIACSLAMTRSHHEHRLALAAGTRAALASGLEAAARGEAAEGLSRGRAIEGRSKVAFVFPGQGSQWVGMGRGLLAEEPVFREALEQCSGAIEKETGRSVVDELKGAGSRLESIEVVQPALFAMGVALSALWRSWGVEPDVVVGHSMGEVAAAYVSGALTLEDAAKVICRRSLLLKRICGQGEMALVQLPAAAATAALSGYEEQLSVAVINSRRSTVLSGEPAALASVLSKLEAEGVFCKRVKVDVASHSPQVDLLRGELLSVLADVSPRAPGMAMRSTVTGRAIGAGDLRAAYWVDNLREPVRLADVVETLLEEGHGVFVEMSPHPVLLPALEELLGDSGKEGAVVGSLYRERPERASMLASLGKLHVLGCPVRLERLYSEGGRRVALPTYAWQRQRYWIEASALRGRGGKATGHPLLGVRVSLAGAEAVYETVLSRAEHPWLYDHRVVEAALLPGAGLAEMMRAAGEHCLDGEAVDVASLVLQAPLMLPEHGGRRVQVVVREEDGRREASVYSQPSEASPESGWTLHASGEIGRTPVDSAARIDLAAVRQRCRERVDVAQAYEAFAATGLSYGPAFQGMQSLWRGPHEAIAEVSLPEGVDGAEQYGMHPALLDAAFQSLFGIAEQEGLYLPFAMERVRVHASGASAATVHVRRREEGDGEGFAADVTVTDGQGVVLAEVTGLRGRAMEGGERREEEVSQSIYQLGWPVSPVPASSAPSGRWAVVARAEDAAADAVVEELRRSGASCVRVEVGGVASALPCDHVVCLWRGWGEDAASAAERLSCEGLSVVQVVARQESPPRLWWVTRGAVSVTADEAADVGQASLWGLGRTVMQEHPELECRLVDVEDGPEVAAAITRELCGGDEEREIAWRGGERHAARVMRAAGIAVPSTENYALAIKRKGMLDGLALVPAVRRRAGRGEVEIEVRASGINFRDVLNVLGMYPGEAGPLGGEFAGVVTAVGEGVEAIAVGASVMGLAAGSFGRYVIADARLVARMPAGLSYEQAATIPVAFLTAWYALHDLAGLKAGERLLVHAAAGGVGMAAVQIARWIGAEVFGTASPSKWEAVRSLGVRAVAHSRELSFVGEIRSATGGANVDVVLNALSGDFIDASLTLLGAGGRFIEMGKTDIREARTVSASHPGVHYRAFDLSEAGAERLAAMLGTIVEGFVCGRLEPLPVRKFAITESETAFRFMAQARHVGKLALVPSRALRSDGTVVITGGLGALGLHVARWLAGRGVKHLVLTGRRGLETPGAAAAVEELSSLGARVTVAAVDVSDGAAVRALLGAIPEDAPLRGVVHAAGVLDDGMLSEQSAARFARVLSAKVGGACHLDALTRGLDLDFFVLFSSTSGALGSAGQGGYSAANVCLDAVAACRRAAGLPGQSLSWGLWVDASSRGAGLASGLDRAQQSRLEKSGFGAVDASRGMALFESVLGRSEAHLLPVPIDVRALRQSFGESVPPLWRSLVRARPRAASASRRVGWAGELALLSEGERLAAVVEIVRGEVARVLSLEGAQAVEADRPLKELGLDSLMAVELRNALGKRAGARLPATLAFDHPTPRRIAQYLIKKVLSPSDAPIVVAPITARPVEQDSLQKRISEIDQFSAAEMERELTQNIERVRAEFGL